MKNYVERSAVSREPTAPAVRILVVDDHGMVCEGLTVLLERADGFTVVGTATTGHEGLLAAVRLKPDVIIMDLMLPDINGIDVTERVLKLLPAAHVVALSACHTTEHVYRALRAGAHGYLVKDAVSAELVRAVKTVMAGKRYLSPALALLAVDGSMSNNLAKSPIERLSSREREVLHRIVGGASSADIAVHLSLSRKTVDTYRSRLMVKLGVGNRSALIRFAIEHDLVAL